MRRTTVEINDQSFHLKKIETGKIKPNVRKKGRIDEWNSMQYKTIKIEKTQWNQKLAHLKINEIDKLLARLKKKKGVWLL